MGNAGQFHDREHLYLSRRVFSHVVLRWPWACCVSGGGAQIDTVPSSLTLYPSSLQIPGDELGPVLFSRDLQPEVLKVLAGKRLTVD